MHKNYRISIHLALLLAISFVLLISCSQNRVNRNIESEVNKIRIVDTHEHFPPESARKGSAIDFFTLVIGYLQADMVSSGMTTGQLNFILDPKNTPEDRWNQFYPYWQNAKYTGYGLCLRETIRGLFGVNELNPGTFRIVDRLMRESVKNDNWYRHVLKEKAGIDVSIVDPLGVNSLPDVQYPSEFFVKVRRFDHFTVINARTISSIGKQYGVAIRSLDGLLTALDTAFSQAVFKERIVGIKSGLAYSRKIHYEDVPEQEARILFEKVKDTLYRPSAAESTKLADFMFHQIVARAEKYNLPIQIHTGILSRNFHANPIENTNAIHLSNLFLKYRKARFVIFHGSFPYMEELTYLAKHYPNVYIDMCWMYIISPQESRKFLREWLQTVPVNKIMAFGGDATVEWTYGHSVMARQAVTEVLSRMFEEGYLSEEEAISVARKILRENAIELFGLKKTGENWSGSR